MSLRLALTPGEPAGIGPELLVRVAAAEDFACEIIAVADANLLEQTAKTLGLKLCLHEFNEQRPNPSGAGHLTVLHVPAAVAIEPGTLNPGNSTYVLKTLEIATEGCLRKRFDALVTGPVHKGVINQAGIAFTGHTEFLAERSNTEQVVMMLACEGLRVALVTTHIPLRQVADAITPAKLKRVIEVLYHDLENQFGLNNPRVLVCGLNPHAGEGGHMGREEIDVIQPVIHQLREQHGWNLSDPLPADTLFVQHHLDHADAVLAMYHDQGLPVLKHKGFGAAANITLGLPFVRTSVDHGTALDLVGSNKANTGSLLTAINCAKAMSANKR